MTLDQQIDLCKKYDDVARLSRILSYKGQNEEKILDAVAKSLLWAPVPQCIAYLMRFPRVKKLVDDSSSGLLLDILCQHVRELCPPMVLFWLKVAGVHAHKDLLLHLCRAIAKEQAQHNAHPSVCWLDVVKILCASSESLWDESLAECASHASLNDISVFLLARANCLGQVEGGRTPLGEALRGQNHELLALMTQYGKGVRPDSIVESGLTLVEQTVRLGHLPTIRFLFGSQGIMRDYALVIPPSAKSQSLLLHAVVEHHGAVVEWLAQTAMVVMSSDTFRAVVAHMCLSQRPFVSKARMMARIMALWPDVGKHDISGQRDLGELLLSATHIFMLVNDLHLLRATNRLDCFKPFVLLNE